MAKSLKLKCLTSAHSLERGNQVLVWWFYFFLLFFGFILGGGRAEAEAERTLSRFHACLEPDAGLNLTALRS